MRRLCLPLVIFTVLSGCRDAAQRHLERARDALYDGRHDVALAEYKLTLDVLSRDSSPQATLYRARALRGAADLYTYQLKDTRRAVEVYRELITLCPEAPETLEGRLHLAELLQRDFRDLRGAITEYSAALARNPPQSAEIAFTVARLYFELMDYSQCELEAQRLVERYETSAWVDDALYLRGQALSLMDGRRGDAQRAWADLVSRFPESPFVPLATVELGRLKYDQGDPEGAIELWVTALATHPTPSAVQKQIALVREQLRNTAPRGKVGEAVTAFDWDRYPAPARKEEAPRSSDEAVGAGADEAAH